jgi:hypothetical protein
VPVSAVDGSSREASLLKEKQPSDANREAQVESPGQPAQDFPGSPPTPFASRALNW